MRRPGGNNAEEMLRAAVTASQVTHSNLVGVYDAIDEGDLAFVVREWIDGSALREAVFADGPFDAERATFVLHSVSEAIAALHTVGTTHGNIHPGTVLIGDDGRVVLTDARFDATDSLDADVRAVGAIGYFMLTGQWPELPPRPARGPADPRRCPRRAQQGARRRAELPRRPRHGPAQHRADAALGARARRRAVPFGHR